MEIVIAFLFGVFVILGLITCIAIVASVLYFVIKTTLENL